MKKHVHFMGICGSGASGVAAIAKVYGFQVSGCDKNLSGEFAKELKGCNLHKGHSASHLKDNNVNILAISPAITSLDPNNPELLEAKKLGIEILTWQEFRGKYLLKDKFVIAVCGSHGKSTTTAMVAKILVDAKFDPTVQLGAIVPEWGRNFRIGKSSCFLAEADEFNNNFLDIYPDILIVLNIDFDHPEFFQDLKEYKNSFKKFLLQTKQTIVANLNDPNMAEVIKDVMKNSKVTVLDFSKNLNPHQDITSNQLGLNLKIPGFYNLSNATAAFEVGLILNINPQIINKSLNNYQGISRRQELIGGINGAKIFSDFGHHPTEIKNTIEGLFKKWPNQKIYLIFQPHMFARTKVLFKDFIQTFQKLPVEKAFILDIYPSREVDTGLINSQQLVEAINKNSIRFINKNQLLDQVINKLTEHDILIFMGAGDIDQIAKNLLTRYI